MFRSAGYAFARHTYRKDSLLKYLHLNEVENSATRFTGFYTLFKNAIVVATGRCNMEG